MKAPEFAEATMLLKVLKEPYFSTEVSLFYIVLVLFVFFYLVSLIPRHSEVFFLLIENWFRGEKRSVSSISSF